MPTIYTLLRRETLNLMGGGLACRPFILCYDATLNLMGGGYLTLMTPILIFFGSWTGARLRGEGPIGIQ